MYLILKNKKKIEFILKIYYLEFYRRIYKNNHAVFRCTLGKIFWKHFVYNFNVKGSYLSTISIRNSISASCATEYRVMIDSEETGLTAALFFSRFVSIAVSVFARAMRRKMDTRANVTCVSQMKNLNTLRRVETEVNIYPPQMKNIKSENVFSSRMHKRMDTNSLSLFISSILLRK